jgi:thiol-disulfide isomerase/thioredoxin
MNRRQVALLGVIGAAAAGGGMAWSWRHASSRFEEGEAALWDLSFEQPDGRTLVLAALRGQPLLLNFWATWCVPCIKEMPMLDRFYRDKRASGWTVVGLAVDSAQPVREYLARLPITFPIGLAGMGGVDLSGKLGNTQGGLPFTVVFDRQGKAIGRRVGALEPSHLQRWERELAITT